MLDTVVLILNDDQFKVIEHERFSPSTKGIFEQPYYPFKNYIRCIQNPTKKDYKTGVYKPRLTVTKQVVMGGVFTNLIIEFSAPKLLFGNNFMELQDSDFQAIIETLQARLKEMGVLTSFEVLRNAKVSAIHYSKNIILDKHTSIFMIINELEKIDLTKRLDVSRITYINGGYALRCHCNSWELVFYDKIKEMEQAIISEKRGMEKNHTPQMKLFTKYPINVLRMEARLKQPKLLQMLNKIYKHSNPPNLTFEGLFSRETSKAILTHYWGEITKGMPLIGFNTSKPEDLYSQIGDSIKGNSILRIIGSISLIDSIGVRGFRALTGISASAWQRQKKKLEEIKNKVSPKYLAIRQIGNALNEFRSLGLGDYKQLGFRLDEKGLV